MKILLSWYAKTHDFNNGDVNLSGPTCQFHRDFFQHDRHLILSSQAGDDLRAEKLLNRLMLEFPERKDLLSIQYMDVSDVIDMAAIKRKVEPLLLRFADHELDLFISPGTPAMQVSWYLCHLSLNLKTRLLQTREARFTKTGKPELVVVQAEQSAVPISIVLKEEGISNTRKTKSDYLITPSLKPVYERADKLAQTDHTTCLIYGSSGTGKEHLARYIHNQSSRSGGAFMAVNCSALGDTLLESRLFGYEKGAFTGAEKRTDGFFDTAKGGTLFLDEIGDISAYMQQSLLRVLQTNDYTPVGSTKPRKADVRIIAATHRSLRHACETGQFRWDLFYRLSVAELQLPTLSERGSDEKRALVKHFLERKRLTFRRKNALKLSNAVWRMVDSYQFPGNVRELENLIESLYVFAGDTANLTDLPDWLTNPITAQASFDWRSHEKALIRRALGYFRGNKSQVCSALGYGSINTLVKKIEEYQLG